MNTRTAFVSILFAAAPLVMAAAACTTTTTTNEGPTCASVCASCGTNAGTCTTQCQQLTSACDSAGHPEYGNDLLQCLAGSSCNQNGQLDAPGCTSIEQTALSCGGTSSSSGASSSSGSGSGSSTSSSGNGSSSGSGGGSSTSSSGGSSSSSGSGSGSGSGSSSGSSSGSGSGSSSGGMDAGTVCYAGAAFTADSWAPPTALHQNACTATQITAFYNSLSNQQGPWTSGSTSCDACLMTDTTASAYGPIISANSGGMEIPQRANLGGCQADLDGNKAAGSCGDKDNDINDCLYAECGTCSDYNNPTQTGPTATCEQTAVGSGGQCGSYYSSTCYAELNPDAGASQCASGGLQGLLTLWCGQ